MLIPFIQLDVQDQVTYWPDRTKVLGAVTVTAPSLDPFSIADWFSWIQNYQKKSREIVVNDHRGTMIGIARNPIDNGNGTLTFELHEPAVKWVWGADTFYTIKDLRTAIANYCVEEMINNKIGQVEKHVRRADLSTHHKAGTYSITVTAGIGGLED